jgi:hypothetical protein
VALKRRFLDWWSSPSTSKERAATTLISGWAGLWFGAIGCVVFNQAPFPFGVMVQWAVAGSALSAVLGALFPKSMRCLAFPFTFLGFGSWS